MQIIIERKKNLKTQLTQTLYLTKFDKRVIERRQNSLHLLLST